MKKSFHCRILVPESVAPDFRTSLNERLKKKFSNTTVTIQSIPTSDDIVFPSNIVEEKISQINVSISFIESTYCHNLETDKKLRDAKITVGTMLQNVKMELNVGTIKRNFWSGDWHHNFYQTK